MLRQMAKNSGGLTQGQTMHKVAKKPSRAPSALRGMPAVSTAISILPRRPGLPGRTLRKTGPVREQSSNATREKILDAAEKLFAEKGYDGTSIRDVAAVVEYQIQAISYHFGPKEQLFNAVVQRRAAVMTELRVRALAAMQAEAKGAPIDIPRLIRAYVEPFIASAHDSSKGWRNYAPLGTEIIARHYDSTAREYMGEFLRSLPRAKERSVIEGFMFMVASMLFICADTGRIEALSKSSRAKESPSALLERLVKFIAAGFNALAGGS
jgi:AcrR family transcriptional regulator